ncbi:four-carbon acid sugar kinase family protein [Exercitatus varius]|uniref:four-carbon acid sugar kinase family protein n=1 Tax=Exercitatus varius TaxID=67857 RepID=UPI00294B7C6D|nr:four-carbon acid sugar kinase family protein [Exercitatus varius]MDG2952131.1 four-carbon acid sugar kinase family protein [Exercitatus varius]
MKNDKLLVVADDLTGANDTGVMFAEAGFNTLLETNVRSLESTDVSCAEIFSVSTDSRPIGTAAENKTKMAILKGIEKGMNQLYLKIDSTMRGSVNYQIKGALAAWETLYPDTKAVICPAYPTMGRTIENGHLYVNGTPVNETASGKDAICPVKSSSMQDLLPEAICLACTPENELIEKILSVTHKQIVIDAKTEEDLTTIAKAINRLGNGIIPVGSAGLAQKLKLSGHKLAEKTKINLGRSLILVTSIHETSQNQVDQYISGIGGKSVVFNPSPSQLINHQISSEALLQQFNALIHSSRENVIIRANPAKVVNNIDGSINEIARKIAEYLANLGLHALNTEKFDSLILFGGDGAATLLDKMNISEMKVSYAIVPGVPLCTVTNGPYKGLNVMTKSGGFGNHSLLIDILSVKAD